MLACAIGAALAAMPARTAPLAPKTLAIDLGASSPIEHVRDHCGRGWHRTRWRDHWGYWHWGDCVLDGGPYGGRGAEVYYPYPDWRGAAPWGWSYP
jgi:hypothetical protein